MRKPCWFLVVSLIGSMLGAQGSPVLLVPWDSDPLAKLAKQLNTRLESELIKTGVKITYSNQKSRLQGPELKSFLAAAGQKNFSFVLLQFPDAGDPKILRHDLWRIGDQKLMASVLVQGDSVNAALLRANLLAREIQSQLKELPKVFPPQKPDPPLPKPDPPVKDPQTIIPDSQNTKSVDPFPISWPRIEISINPSWILGPWEPFMNFGITYGLNCSWNLTPNPFIWTLGARSSFFSQTAKGEVVELPMTLSTLGVQTGIQLVFWDIFAWESQIYLGADLLTYDRPGNFGMRTLLGFGGESALVLLMPKPIQVKLGYGLSGVLESQFPLFFQHLILSIGFQL